MRYQVLEGNKPADCKHHYLHRQTNDPNPCNCPWNTSTFDTLEEATKYLLDYFSPYIPSWSGVGKVEFYDNCFAEIREIKEN